MPPSPDPRRIARLGLIGWGLGQVALGDARGWLLLVLEALWLAAIVVTWTLIETDRWLLTFALLSGFLVVWAIQAAAAQRTAERRAGASTGGGQVAWLLPVAMVVVTGFWLLGGTTSSAPATFERYLAAWQTDHPQAAVGLFVDPPTTDQVEAGWASADALVTSQVDQLAAAHPDWELDTAHPATNVRFEYPAAAALTTPDEVHLEIQIVRLATVSSTFFGIMPATATETEVVEVIGVATVVRRPASGWQPMPDASIWLITEITYR